MDETANETQARLLEVIAHADFQVWPGLYAFAPVAFRVFAFHFDPAYDATGFVGWLHAHLARATGAGHIVVCGRSAGAGADHVRGGIFDYWGCPAGVAGRVLAKIEALCARGRQPRRAHVGPRGGCLLCEALGGIPGFPIVAENERAGAVLNEAFPYAWTTSTAASWRRCSR